ncbi:MAG: class I adenylate-forming enzyme family protein [Caulobacterales bacterium]
MSDPITRWALSHPADLAISHTSGDYSYGELARRIAAARAFLAGQRLPKRGLAVVCIVSAPEAWAVGFALRSLGLTTVAVRYLSEVGSLGLDGAACVVVSGLETLPELAGWRGPRVIRAPFDVLAGAGPVAPAKPSVAKAGGHIVLTSGATGTPRRVLIDGATAPSHLAQRAAAFDLASPAFVNVFDWGTWTSVGYLAPLQVWELGGTVVIRQPADLGPAHIARQVTRAIATPMILTELLARPTPTRQDQMKLFVGGGPLPPALAEAALARLTSQLATIVASTEAGVWCVTDIARPQDTASHVPAPGRVVQVVDEAGQALAPGEVGAIRIGVLEGVTGYFQNPQASRASFRDGFFYPGDLGAFGRDGRLTLKGRASDTIAVAGQKRAPEPIEALILARLGADAVAVFSAAGEEVNEELHVAIQARAPITRDQLTELAKTELKVFPRVHFHFVEALPRNDRGKLLRFALRQQILAAWTG